MNINYIKGDLFEYLNKPRDDDHHVIVPHITNNVKVWGSGFVIPLGNRFPAAKRDYLENPFSSLLGNTEFVQCGTTHIANMCAQNGLISKTNVRPLNYLSLAHCLSGVKIYADTWSARGVNVSIYAPAFGSDRAGGKWGFISLLIEDTLIDYDTTVFYLDDKQKERLGI